MKFNTTSVAEAYKALGVERVVIPVIPGLPEERIKYMQDEQDLHTFIDAVNKESNDGIPWIADFTNSEDKIRPWFWVSKSDTHPSGFVFSNADCGYASTLTSCGSRFCFHSVEAWRHAINTPEVIDLFLMVWTKKY